MVSALNFKPYAKGSIKGFFDCRYHGITIKGCRLMTGNNGLWVAFPQQQGTDDGGQVKYYDQLYLAAPEMDHVRRAVIADLQAQGHINRPTRSSQRSQSSQGNRQPQQQGRYRSPEGEDLSEYYSDAADDDIPF